MAYGSNVKHFYNRIRTANADYFQSYRNTRTHLCLIERWKLLNIVDEYSSVHLCEATWPQIITYHTVNNTILARTNTGSSFSMYRFFKKKRFFWSNALVILIPVQNRFRPDFRSSETTSRRKITIGVLGTHNKHLHERKYYIRVQDEYFYIRRTHVTIFAFNSFCVDKRHRPITQYSIRNPYEYKITVFRLVYRLYNLSTGKQWTHNTIVWKTLSWVRIRRDRLDIPNGIFIYLFSPPTESRIILWLRLNGIYMVPSYDKSVKKNILEPIAVINVFRSVFIRIVFFRLSIRRS